MRDHDLVLDVNPDSKIYIAGQRGLVVSASVCMLTTQGYRNLITRTHAELDLIDQTGTRTFFESEKPEYVRCKGRVQGGKI